MGVGPWKSRLQLLPSWSSDLVAQLFTESVLPKDFAGFIRSSFGVTHRESSSVFGEHSATWLFQNKGQPIQVSVDFPFAGLHELEGCYESSGEQVLAPAVTTEESLEGLNAQVHEVKFMDELNQISYLWYLSCDAEGAPVTKFRVAMWGGALATPPVAFQMQVYASDCGELTEQQRAAYKQALLMACKSFLPPLKQLWAMQSQ